MRRKSPRSVAQSRSLKIYRNKKQLPQSNEYMTMQTQEAQRISTRQDKNSNTPLYIISKTLDTQNKAKVCKRNTHTHHM